MAAKKEYLLRIDPELWNELQSWAADELRSVNAQIEYILRNAVTQRRRQQKDDTIDPARAETQE